MPSLRSRVFRPFVRRLTARAGSFACIQEMRAAQERWLNRPILPRGVSMQRVLAGAVQAEWIAPTDCQSTGVLLYLHGGAWTLGWYEPHRWLVGHLARATGMRALALDYRLAPEHPYPAALEDCLAAYRWLLSNGTPPKHIVIAGDSAGGNLSLTTMLALREAGEPVPAAAACLSPPTDLAGSGEPAPAERDSGLPVDWAQQQMKMYLGATDPRLPLVSPIYADLRGLPPVLIQVGEEEWLCRDAVRFAERARAAGVDVTLQVWPAMWHVWHLLVPLLPEARQAVDAIAAFTRRQVAGGPG